MTALGTIASIVELAVKAGGQIVKWGAGRVASAKRNIKGKRARVYVVDKDGVARPGKWGDG